MNETGTDLKFQETGKQVEQEMFKLEGILTERMLKQEKGLDKVIDSFYKIVYTFFPKYNKNRLIIIFQMSFIKIMGA